MELMQLEMLVAVAEEHSFLRAAERVFRTQPAVSIGIRKLEGRVGVSLLDRSSGRSGRLTPAGEQLYEYARKILGLRDEALSVINRKDKPSEGTLHIGLVGEESLDGFPSLWKWFKGPYPRAEAKISSGSLSVVLSELANGRLDLAFVSGKPRCDAQKRNLVATRLRKVSGHGWLWVVRQKLGKSPLAQAFEKKLLESFPPRARISEPKRIGHRRLAVLR